MKKLYKTALLAALGLGGITAAQAASYNGDLLVGFTSASGNDLVYDLGSYSSLYNGESWDLTSLVSGFNLSTVNWGVIGSINNSGTKYAWATYDGNSIDNSAAWTPLNNSAIGIYGYFGTAGAGQSASMAYNDATDNSWDEQTISGPLTTSYVNENGNPNVAGLTSNPLYQYVVGGGSPTDVGSFSLGGPGTLTFNAVPEPSTLGVMALGGLLVVSMRRKFFNHQA